jgi:hypothetical protein
MSTVHTLMHLKMPTVHTLKDKKTQKPKPDKLIFIARNI